MVLLEFPAIFRCRQQAADSFPGEESWSRSNKGPHPNAFDASVMCGFSHLFPFSPSVHVVVYWLLCSLFPQDYNATSPIFPEVCWESSTCLGFRKADMSYFKMPRTRDVAGWCPG